MTTYPKANFGPKNSAEEQTFSEEAFLVDLQVYIHELMERKGVSKSMLAAFMGYGSEETLDLVIFSDGSHLDVRTVAKIFYHLGETPKISSEPCGPEV